MRRGAAGVFKQQATHSLVLALLLAVAGHRLARRWQLPPLRTAGFVALVAASSSWPSATRS